MGYDGSIKIKTEIDDKSAEKRLNALERKMKGLEDKLSKSTSDRNAIADKLKTAQKEAIAAYSEVEKLEKKLAESQARTSPDYKGSIDAAQFAEELESQKQISAELENQRKILVEKEKAAEKLEEQDAKAVLQIEAQTAELERHREEVDQVNLALARQGLSSWPQVRESAQQAMDSASNSMRKGLRTLLKFGLGIRSVYVLFRKLRTVLVEGIKEYANYDAETRASIDGLRASLNGLKGSFVSAFAPIFNAAAPALQYLIDMVTNAMNAVAAFIAVLGGKTTYKKAVTGISSAAGAISDAAGAAKELDRYMSGLDEMQKWQSDSSSGGGGGGGSGGSGSGMAWEDVPIDMDSWGAQFAINVRDILFKWDDLTPEDIAKKVITGLTTLVGLIAGLALTGSLAGGLIFAIAGAALGVAISTIVFNGDGKIDEGEIRNLLLIVCGALAGTVIGAVIGGPAGAALGFLIGAGVTLALMGIEVDDGEGGKVNLLDKIMGWLKKTTTGNILTCVLSPTTGVVMSIQAVLELIPTLSIFEDKTGSGGTVAFGDWVETTLSNCKTLLQLKWDTLVSPFFSETIPQKVKDLKTNIGKWFRSIKSAVQSKVADVANGVIDPLNQLISNITTALAGTEFGEWLADKLSLGSLTDLQIPRVEIDVTANLTETKDSIPKDQKTVAGMTSEFSRKAYAAAYSKDIPGMRTLFSRKGYESSYDKTVTGMKSQFASRSFASGFDKSVPGMKAVLKSKGFANGFDYQITKMIGVLKTYTFSTAWKVPQAFTTALLRWYDFSSSWKVPYAFTTATFKWSNFSTAWKTPWAYMTAYFSAHEFSTKWKAAWAYMTGYFNSWDFAKSWSKPWAYVTAYFKETGGVYYNGAWRPFGQYASGGYPFGGQMFIAREAGPELVGTLKGHTAVMNNDQIVASVSAGVARAISSVAFHLSGLPAYQPVTPDRYPSIAQGGVIPPKILDALDKLSEIKSAIDSLTARLSDSRGNNSYQFTAQLDRRTLFDELIEEAQMRRNQSGLNPFMAV